MDCLNEMTKCDHKLLKGVAVISMVMLHLFCRLGEQPYTPLIWINKVPFVYYLGLFGDICFPIFAFLSGYAHYLQNTSNEDNYINNVRKLRNFVLNIWVVIFVLSVLGFVFNKEDQVPGSAEKLIKCLLLMDTYAGAWWHIPVYIILVFLSLQLYRITSKHKSQLIFIIFIILYVISYLFRFRFQLQFTSSIISWIFEKTILTINTSFSYIVGMLYRKHLIISIMRNKFKLVLVGMVGLAFLFHCIFQSVFLAPFNAFIVLTALMSINLSIFLKKVLLVLGRHSTNTWLYHMFFYLTLFPGLVFKAKWPILIFAEMIFFVYLNLS